MLCFIDSDSYYLLTLAFLKKLLVSSEFNAMVGAK